MPDEVRPDQVATDKSLEKEDEAKVAPVAEDEMGLGMDSFLSTPSPTEEPAGDDEKKPDPKEDAKGEGEGTEEGKKEEPTPDDKKPDKTPEAKPEGDKKPSPDAVKEKPKDDDKPEVKDDKPKEDPNVKRLRDTQNWATDLNKQVQEQNRQMAIMAKKIDGTFDEEKDDPKQTVEQIETAAEVRGRTRASRETAVGKFGEDKTTEDLQKFHDIFGQDRHIQASIIEQDMPALEAIKMVRRHEFFEEFGYEPDEIIEKVRVKVRVEETDKIREEEVAKLADRIKGKKGEAVGLAGLSSKGGTTPSTEKAKGPAPLKSMFDN